MLLAMQDRELYAQILGLVAPWRVTEVQLDRDAGEVVVRVESEADRLPCPTCEKACSRYDHRARRWRHLDTCQYQTILEAEVPRVKCAEHGVLQASVPWAGPNSRFTALFEALAIDWLREASIAAVARQLRMTWDELSGVMERAVRRGLQRRGPIGSASIAIDETSFQKRHEYVTVVTDHRTKTVLHVADDRKVTSLDGYFAALTEKEIASLRSISMDMWKPYIAAVRARVRNADEKIGFDRFHVASHLGDAVDRVRRAENKALRQEGDDTLVGSRYLWLRSPQNMATRTWQSFKELRESSLKTARAWAIKEMASRLWHYRSRGWARRAWTRWIGWAMRSRLEPIKQAARMIRDHLWGILNAVVSGASNAAAESINAKIQRIKRMACGFRNRQRFRTAIYFHLGGLDLYPPVHVTHTNA